MYTISEIELANWKNFEKVNIPLQNRMFIIGANATGKSNFLDVFRFLRDIVNNGLQKAVRSRGGIKKTRNLNARNKNSIMIKVKLSNEKADYWTYELEFNSAGGSSEDPDTLITYEKVINNGIPIRDRNYNDPSEDRETRKFTHLEQPAMNSQYRVIYDFFKGIEYVNIIPQLIRESDSYILTAGKEDLFGRNLINRIATINNRTQTKYLNSIKRVLEIAVPLFDKIEFKQDENGTPHLQARYKHWRPNGAWQREDQFSDGTLRLIGLIWAIMDGEGLLLLEEPELYLHNAIVRQLPEFIVRAQKRKTGKRQVIISSHSYELLNTDTIGSDEIAVLEQGALSAEIRIASNIENINHKLNSGFTPADAVMNYTTPKDIMNNQLSFFDVNG